MSVKVPGAYSTLMIFMAIFVAKYIFGYFSATDAAFYSHIRTLELGINGLFSGFFFGKSVRYLKFCAQEK